MPTFEVTSPNNRGELLRRLVWTGDVQAQNVADGVVNERTGETGTVFEVECPDCSATLTLFLTRDRRLRIIRSIHPGGHSLTPDL